MKFDGAKLGKELVELVRGFLDREHAALREANEQLTARVKELEGREFPNFFKMQTAITELQEFADKICEEKAEQIVAPLEVKITAEDVLPHVTQALVEFSENLDARFTAIEQREIPDVEPIETRIIQLEEFAERACEVPEIEITEDDLAAPLAETINPIKEQLEAAEHRLSEIEEREAARLASQPNVDEIVRSVVAEQGFVRQETLDEAAQAIRNDLSQIADSMEKMELPELPDLPDFEQLVAEAVEKMPKPRDGKDADLDEMTRLIVSGIDNALPDALAKLPEPISVRSVLIDRNGHLIAVMSDGRDQDVGRVVGKKGRDGFQLEDFDAIVLDDDRTIALKFIAGEHEHIVEMKFPTVLDRGVFKDGNEYEHGDAVTWAGNLWIAQRATSLKPGTDNSGWRLAVKRGQDGKDARKEVN